MFQNHSNYKFHYRTVTVSLPNHYRTSTVTLPYRYRLKKERKKETKKERKKRVPPRFLKDKELKGSSINGNSFEADSMMKDVIKLFDGTSHLFYLPQILLLFPGLQKLTLRKYS